MKEQLDIKTLQRVGEVFNVFSETYPTHSPALRYAFKEWLDVKIKEIIFKDDNLEDGE
jgi:hypothetical protein